MYLKCKMYNVICAVYTITIPDYYSITQYSIFTSCPSKYPLRFHFLHFRVGKEERNHLLTLFAISILCNDIGRHMICYIYNIYTIKGVPEKKTLKDF